MKVFRQSWRLLCAIGAVAGLLATNVANAQAYSDPAYDFTEVQASLDNPLPRNLPLFAYGGLVIYHKGNRVYESGFGLWKYYDQYNLDLQAPINVASLSKAYSAALAAAVMQDPNVGLSLNSLVKNYITDATTLNAARDSTGGLVFDRMTIGHLMSMSTGQVDVPPFPLNVQDPLTCINTAFVSFETCGRNMVADPVAIQTPPAVAYEPGKSFAYGPAPWQILGLILVKAVNAAYHNNETFEQILKRYLTDACAFDRTTTSPAGNPWIAGGYYSTLRGGGQLALLLQRGQCLDGHQLLTPTSRAALQQETKGSNPEVNNPDAASNGNQLGYARGLWISTPYPAGDPRENEKIYMGVGAWGAIVFYSPTRDWAAYLHLDDHTFRYNDAVRLAEALARQIDIQADAHP